jgi:vacuolar-type H+-ATPase subunit H
MMSSNSPLQIINQKEAELRGRLEAAQQQLEAQLQSARDEAKRRITQADQAGHAEAQALYGQSLETARREAEAIVAAAHEQAEALRRQAEARLDFAAGRIVELVLTSHLASDGDTIKNTGRP